MRLDAVARAGLQQPQLDAAAHRTEPATRAVPHQVAESMLRAEPYPIELLLLYESNPIYSEPAGRRWAEAIERVPFVVSFSRLPDESVLWADLVLPDCCWLQRWELVEPAELAGSPAVALRRPALNSEAGTKPAADVILALAKQLGGLLSRSMPWSDGKAAILAGLNAATGAGESVEAVRAGPRNEWATGTLAAELSIAERLVGGPGWWAGTRGYEQWSLALRRPGGKFLFLPPGAAAGAGAARRSASLAEFAGDPAEYPLLLLPYRPAGHVDGVRYLTLLREQPVGPVPGLSWYGPAELAPADASQLGLANGDWVSIESPAGQVERPVRVLEGVRPGTVRLPVGFGPWPPSPNEPGNAAEHLLLPVADRATGLLTWNCVRVRLKQVSGKGRLLQG